MNDRNKDIYLPNWLLVFGILLIAAALVCTVLAFDISFMFLAIAVPGIALGAAALLCWENQGVTVTDDQTFLYRTMFGNVTEHRFCEIVALDTHAYSVALITESGKIHIENCAVVSERFSSAANAALRQRKVL